MASSPSLKTTWLQFPKPFCHVCCRQPPQPAYLGGVFTACILGLGFFSVPRQKSMKQYWEIASPALVSGIPVIKRFYSPDHRILGFGRHPRRSLRTPKTTNGLWRWLSENPPSRLRCFPFIMSVDMLLCSPGKPHVSSSCVCLITITTRCYLMWVGQMHCNKW